MRKVLIVVDMQHDFVDGALGTPEARALTDRLFAYVRDFEGDLVFTMDTHGQHYLDTQEGIHLPIEHCIRGTKGWELLPALAALQKTRQAPVFEKSSFGSKELAEWLASQHDIDPFARIELCGLCTDICVVSNALLIKASLPEVPLCVHAQLCAGVTPSLHEAALTIMASCQVDILN